MGLHLQIFPLDMALAERWFYFPIAGLLGLVLISGSQFNLFNQKKLLYFFVILIIFALSIRTFIRTFDWRNGLTLFSHDIKLSGKSFNLENNLGVGLFRTGRVEEAAIHFENSTKLAPYWWTNWNNLGAVAEAEGDLESAEKHYKKAIGNGKYYLAYFLSLFNFIRLIAKIYYRNFYFTPIAAVDCANSICVRYSMVHSQTAFRPYLALVAVGNGHLQPRGNERALAGLYN